MSLWRLSYGFAYRFGRTPWDTGITPPEVVDLIEGPRALASGAALDLGCGTGTNVRYLAEHGWDATGVEGDHLAFRSAVARLRGVEHARVLFGNVTRLGSLPLNRTFDLVLDVGCFHSIAPRRRDDYVAGVVLRTREGASLFVFAFGPTRSVLPLGVSGREMRDRFAPWFEPVGRIRGERPPGAAWYLLRRTDHPV